MKVLYHFAGPQIRVMEIKRTDLVGEVDKAKKFFWLLIRNDDTIAKLVFENMTESTRTFAGGEVLCFDESGATFSGLVMEKCKNDLDELGEELKAKLIEFVTSERK